MWTVFWVCFQTNGRTVYCLWMTCQSHVPSGERWLGLEGLLINFTSISVPRSPSRALALVRSWCNLSHRLHAEDSGVDAEVCPPHFQYSYILYVWHALVLSQWSVWSNVSHKPVCSRPFTVTLWVSGVSLPDTDEFWSRAQLEDDAGYSHRPLMNSHSSLFPCSMFLHFSIPPSIMCSLQVSKARCTCPCTKNTQGCQRSLQSVTSRALLTFLIRKW